MKKLLFTLTFITIFSKPSFAIIEVKQEVTTEKATYSCYGKKCERTKGEKEDGTEFEYTSITTSNSGKSVVKKKYKCITNNDGAKCKPIY